MKLARCVDLLISLVIVPALRVNHIHQDLQKSGAKHSSTHSPLLRSRDQ